MSSYDIWVDFNSINSLGTVVTLEKCANIPMIVGSLVMAGDIEGNRCPATVLEVASPMVSLRLYLDGFVPAAS